MNEKNHDSSLVDAPRADQQPREGWYSHEDDSFDDIVTDTPADGIIDGARAGDTFTVVVSVFVLVGSGLWYLFT